MGVVGTGCSAEGDRWTLTVDDFDRSVLTMLHVQTVDGRRQAAGSGSLLEPGRRFSTWTGLDDEGPHRILVFVSSDVRAVVATLSDGTREDLTLHAASKLGEVRVAALVYPRRLDLHRLVLLDRDGAELPDEI
jgi:hypothetical protein